MKKLVVKFNLYAFVSLFFINSNLFGQTMPLQYIDDFTLLDSARYEITYRLEYVSDIEKPDEKETDIQKLLIGNNLSKYFSYLLFQNDSVCTILQKRGGETVSAPKGTQYYEIIKDYKTNKQTVIDSEDETVFRYEEVSLSFNWAIQSDRKTIMDYPCQKATTEFRGRKYEAWFTFSIPIPDGPYKFCGLPGLIVEIADDQQHFVFTCIGIKTHSSLIPIKNRNWTYTNTTREKFLEFCKKKYRNLTAYYNSFGVTFAIKRDGKFVFNPENFSYPYNPIELE